MSSCPAARQTRGSGPTHPTPHAPRILTATLDNGLTVLIRESRRAPVASFWAWYRVGARNEVPGITGVSHWVEHMLFKGTARFKPGEIFRTVNQHGGSLNGFTWLDYTAYYETLPSSHIPLGAEIEADRMCNAIFDPAEFESERTVIISEREGSENQPTFHLREEVNAAAFKAHPYGQGVIGFKSDLRQLTRDDLFRHYQTYYVPNNATIAVVGDVEAERMLAEIETRFGGISRGAPPPAVRTVEPPQQGQRRVTVRRPAPTATLLAVYHAPAAESSDVPALSVLDTVLSGGKSLGFGGGGGMGRSTRLYRSLVASGLASSAGSSFGMSIDPYLFSVSASLHPHTEPARVEEIVMEELARLRDEPVPEDELERAIKQLRAQFAYADESVGSQAYWLGSLHTVAPALDPDRFLDQLVAVTPDDILRVANVYLNPDQATVGWLEPTAPVSEQGASSATPVDEPIVAAHMPTQPFFLSRPEGCGCDRAPASEVCERRNAARFSSGPASAAAAPKLDLRERRLDNGMRLIAHHDPTSQVAVFDMRIGAGAVADGRTPGLARFTGQVLSRGSQGRTFAELNEELDSLGAAISVGVGREYADVTGRCLREDAPRLIDLMAEIVRQPTFPEAEIEHVREQSQTSLRQILNDTRAQADELLRSTIYPEGHPYHQRTLGTEQTLTTIQRDQLVDFHGRHYQPNRAIVAVAGGLAVEEAWLLIERAFGDWAVGDEAPPVEIPEVAPPESTVRRRGEIAGKSQADIALGLPAIGRDSPDYDALRMVNLILGRLGLMGRLGASVRERQGMAYYVFSNLSAGRALGLWTAQAGVNPVNVDRAIESIIAEVDRLRQDLVDESELSDGKSYLIGSLPLGLESSGAIAGTALDLVFYDLGLDYIEQLPSRINALTREKLQEVARRYLLTDRLVIAVVGPAVSG